MKSATLILTVLVLFVVLVDLSDAWRGNFYQVRRSRRVYTRYCACWYYWWGCSYWRYYYRTTYYYENICLPGWKHNGDRNCNIPVCSPSCQNGGTCIRPNECACPSTSSGIGCASLTCSYQRPCYPGDCTSGTQCTCHTGFTSQNANDGCTHFNQSHNELRPVVGKSNVTLSNIRRFDSKVDFMFILEGLEEEVPGVLEIIWSNQKRFNNLRFEYETFFVPPENLPKRPIYVHESDIGIVEGIIEANVSKVARNGGPIRDEGSFKAYKCESGFSNDYPAKELATCVINDEQFKTLIEHGDWLNIKFKSSSGGFQKLVNIDQQSRPYGTKYYTGLQDVREVQFNFDFIAPKHCSETGAWGTCGPTSTILKIKNEFTKDPIEISWSGWTDDLSGIWEYYVEIFKLSPNPYNKLIEDKPLSPVFAKTIPHRRQIAYPKFTPSEPGMYSVLMETRDFANNSRIARRLVLFDDQSDITLNDDVDGKLYVSSAVAETGYMWQTANAGEDVQIDVVWENHFINSLIEDNMLLYPVDPYPIQFKEIQDDGVLFSEKYVHDSLDDKEGERTRDAITNYHGIVKFEMAKVFTIDETEPTGGWQVVSPFEERTSFSLKLLAGGSRIRVWLRATDVMGHTKTDSTLVTFDKTRPKISNAGSSGHGFKANVQNATYNYTSRITFSSSDDESGVHKIGFAITIKTTGKPDRVVYEGFAPATMKNTTDDPLCDVIENVCFIPNQQLDLDNCWFIISKSDLETSTASVEVAAYNQALLNVSTTFDVGKVKNLQGLEKYNGPENIRIESPTPHGLRVAWDLLEEWSCYSRAEIVLVLIIKTSFGDIKLETFYTPGTSKYFDILGLNAGTDYLINFGMKLPNASSVQQTGVSLSVKTPTANQETDGTDSGVIVGVAIGVLAIVALVVIVVFLIRRGYLNPNVTQTARKTPHDILGEPMPSRSNTKNAAYDVECTDEEMQVLSTKSK